MQDLALVYTQSVRNPADAEVKRSEPLKRALTLLKRVLGVFLIFLGVVYAGDYIQLRYRIAKNRSPYGVVRIRRYYDVTMKNGKPEFYFDQPTEQTCVNSLFPHAGFAPCWYLRRRPTQEVKM